MKLAAGATVRKMQSKNVILVIVSLATQYVHRFGVEIDL